jgi:hypothetical protein
VIHSEIHIPRERGEYYCTMGIICVDCKTDLPTSKFSKNQFKKDKNQRRCKSCASVKNAESMNTAASPVGIDKVLDMTIPNEEELTPKVSHFDDGSNRLQDSSLEMLNIETKDENVTETKGTLENKESVYETKNEDSVKIEDKEIQNPSKDNDAMEEEKQSNEDPISKKSETSSPEEVPKLKDKDESIPEILVPSNRIRVGICAMQKKAKSKPMVRHDELMFTDISLFMRPCNNPFFFIFHSCI